VFARLFLDGRPEEVQAQVRRLRDGRSILDAIQGQVRQLETGLGAADREKLDEYFTSVRELEQRLATAEQWSGKPKPKVDAAPPQNINNPADVIGRSRLMFDLIHLALKTDSTRIITMLLRETREDDSTLLDNTMVFFSSNLGNASSHSTRNLPVLLAGGGFRHGTHLAFDPASPPPLSNLYVSMLQRLGIEADRFGSSTGTLAGLETIH
jgi:hypothetical protein